MISSFSALVDRAFVVGFVLPTLLFFTGLSLVFSSPPFFNQLDLVLSGRSDAGGIAGILATIWFGALLISLLNTTIYRLMEGYYWPANKCQSWKVSEEKRYRKLKSEYERLKSETKISEAQKVLSQLQRDFPTKLNDLLPTRLGNVIRAFERYPNRVYGADGVALWPVLSAVMSNDSRELVANAKSPADMWLNLTVFSALFGTIVFVRAVLLFSEGWCPFLAHLASAVVGFAFAFVAYRMTIQMARSWGLHVRAAFDVHLNNLAKEMGLVVPNDLEVRRQMWISVAQQVLYFHPIPAETDSTDGDVHSQAMPPKKGEADVAVINGIGQIFAERLSSANIKYTSQLAELSDDEVSVLSSGVSISKKRLLDWKRQATILKNEEG